MKKLLTHIFIFSFFFTINSIAKNNCSELDKLSKEYAKCIKDKIDDSLEETGVKKKYKKLKKSKTLVEFFN